MQQREADRLNLGRVGIRPDPARLARIRLTGRWGDRWVPHHQTMARAPVSAVPGQPRMVRRALQTQTEFRRMPFAFFHTRFPEVAKRETRTVLIFGNSGYDLPPAHYSLFEMFCDEPGCDCRRVFFYVVSSFSEDVEAVLTYGWDKVSFYREWLRSDDPHDIAEIKGPSLNLVSPQSELAPALLDLFRRLLLPDRDFRDRVISHYQMFRDEIDKPTGKGRGRGRGPRKKGR